MYEVFQLNTLVYNEFHVHESTWFLRGQGCHLLFILLASLIDFMWYGFVMPTALRTHLVGGMYECTTNDPEDTFNPCYDGHRM
ncbi:hypothetical protein K503DRAFT_766478 [Rhizopogon vinicolor AM-OR11-026]|uniref:Uncharacterized protein n=1 Tax=Rhizopogon vinicolor AM-OR11-026 TaxID=1314800 RepID=A0A1B7ND11_9AGAM|nr:hypothetical protein K503DRAFT_766478 [Rhizopogon vinicolor AM-OR11-026]